MKYTHNLVLSFCSLIVMGYCSAEELTFQLTGELTEVPSALRSEFSVGDPITGSYTFETTAKDRLPANPNEGSYTGSVMAFEITVGTHSLVDRFSNADISVSNDVNGRDAYSVAAIASGETISGFEPQLMALQLVDSSATVFSNDALPIVPPSPGDFDAPEITFDYSDGSFVRMLGTLQTLAVPEPIHSHFAWFVLVLLYRFRRHEFGEPRLGAGNSR